jgi:hypothetical protein
MDNINIIKDIIREETNYKARQRYNKQKEDGTNKKIKPKEQHQKRGRKPKPKEPAPVKEDKDIKPTTEQLNKQYNILMSLIGKADNKYIIDKLKTLNRTNKYTSKNNDKIEDVKQE